MAVCKSGRRRTTVGGREFVWWMHNDGASLRIASDDKAFVVAYQLCHPLEAEPLLRVSGREFPGLVQQKRPVYLVPPQFEHWYSFKGLVRRIIQWSLREGSSLVCGVPHGDRTVDW